MLNTIKNLTKAFIGESQARNRYTFYSKKALKDGYDLVSDIFAKTADQEHEHASILYKLIFQLREQTGEKFDTVHVEAEAPIAFGTTIENLKAAIAGESYEMGTMYPDFAKVADEEGFPLVAIKLRAIAVAEQHHKERYAKVLKELENGSMFKKEEEVVRVCRKCGHVHTGKEALKVCPLCGHDEAYAEKMNENY